MRNLDGDPLESLLVRERVEIIHARNRVIPVSIAFARFTSKLEQQSDRSPLIRQDRPFSSASDDQPLLGPIAEISSGDLPKNVLVGNVALMDKLVHHIDDFVSPAIILEDGLQLSRRCSQWLVFDDGIEYSHRTVVPIVLPKMPEQSFLSYPWPHGLAIEITTGISCESKIATDETLDFGKVLFLRAVLTRSHQIVRDRPNLSVVPHAILRLGQMSIL